MAARPLLLCSRTAMKALIGILIAATLASGSGYAKSDWIDRTLVTVDVTGTWTGSWGDQEEQGVLTESSRSSWSNRDQRSRGLLEAMRVDWAVKDSPRGLLRAP